MDGLVDGCRSASRACCPYSWSRWSTPSPTSSISSSYVTIQIPSHRCLSPLFIPTYYSPARSKVSIHLLCRIPSWFFFSYPGVHKLQPQFVCDLYELATISLSISIRIFFITKLWLVFWHLSCLPFQQQHKQSCYLLNTTDSNKLTSDAKPS
jgi:hypothetical protein